MIQAIIGIPFVIAVISIALNIIFLLMFMWSYSALTAENIIAKITFQCPINSENTKQCRASLKDEDDDEIGIYDIYGEQWRIDAKFMKMKYFANILGLDSRYALERFEGRYKNIEDENSQKQIAYDLGEDTIIDSFTFFGWTPFIDAHYGSSTYQDIKEGYEYVVYKTQPGVITRASIITEKEEESFFDKFNPF